MPFDTMKELVLSGVYAMKEGADAPVGLSAPTAADSCCARRARALATLAVPARSPPRCICRRQRSAPNQLTAAMRLPRSDVDRHLHEKQNQSTVSHGALILAPPVGLEPTTAGWDMVASRTQALAMLAVPARSTPRCICRRQRSAPNQLTAACSTSVRVTNRNKEGESPLSKAGLT